MVMFNMRGFLFLFILLYMIYYIVQIYNNKKITNKTSITSQNIWKKYEELCADKRVNNNTVYNIYKGPPSLRYIVNEKEVKRICEDLRFLLDYEFDLFLDVIIYLDAFFKIHYYVMIEKYDSFTCIPILYDLQKVIINSISTFVFNIPSISRIVDIEDLDSYMNEKTKRLLNILSKYMRIVTKKYNCNNMLDGYDPYSDKHEFM